ncbi:TIF1A-like protein [Mya arenaria]|uniref:TIF1A-like protein n=1 Tax=Mya arenaria TaxID=6604 RepID=A0ABY7FVV7_MYAAR|nr:TIF1A-like protein [Mya arenaria]WAR26362.1 TIF1A-like protein [Mya arenaria]
MTLVSESFSNTREKMASNFEPSIQSCCDFIYDFSCSPCEENGFNTEAHHYCTQCTKYYCENCVSKHNGLYQKHAVLGREDVKKWEAAPGVVDSLMRCVRHNGEELKLVCGDHDQLCCQICVAVEHRSTFDRSNVSHHLKLQSIKHAVLGRKDVKKWEAAPGVADALERCGMHPGEALKLVCGDHDHLCCSVCVAIDHMYV